MGSKGSKRLDVGDEPMVIVTLRVQATVRDKLRALARAERRTLSSMGGLVVEEGLQARDKLRSRRAA